MTELPPLQLKDDPLYPHTPQSSISNATEKQVYKGFHILKLNKIIIYNILRGQS